MPFFEHFQWWLTAVEIPILTSLFWLIWRLSNALANFKLVVAEHYARYSDLKEVEGRLTSHLLRIEAKLDTTALKTEALIAGKENKS